MNRGIDNGILNSPDAAVFLLRLSSFMAMRSASVCGSASGEPMGVGVRGCCEFPASLPLEKPLLRGVAGSAFTYDVDAYGYDGPIGVLYDPELSCPPC